MRRTGISTEAAKAMERMARLIRAIGAGDYPDQWEEVLDAEMRVAAAHLQTFKDIKRGLS